MAKKPPYNFGTSIETDAKTGAVEAVYFQVRRGRAARVEEKNDGAVFINYDKNGYLLGVELLAPCSIQVLDRLAATEPSAARSQMKSYFRHNVPQGMLVSS